MGTDNRRILVAAVVSVAILLVWQLLFPPPKPAPKPAEPAAAEAQKTPPPAAPAGTPAPASPAAAVAPAAPSAPEELVLLETADFRATFTSHGGALKSYVLKDPKYQHEVKGKLVPIELVRVGGGSPYPYAVAASPELGGSGSLFEEASGRAPMRVAARDGKSVTFEGTAGAAKLTKTFAVGDRPFELGLRLKVEGDRVGAVSVLGTGFLPQDAPKPGFFSGGAFVDYLRPICRADGKTERLSDDKGEVKVPGAVQWAGLEQFYFLAVMLPEKVGGECTFLHGPVKGELATAVRLPVERTLDTRLTLVVGPKQAELLKAYDRSLEQAIDYGPITRYFAFFAQLLMKLMKWFAGFVHNWGIAIMLLTLTVKLVLLPLTVKSMQSMNEMRKLQPEIDKLREKFKDDKEQLNIAVMKMYQEHKVNPLGGCLPLLLQMPIFFALWAALQTSVELYREPFLWIQDLSLHDPIYVLPLVMGGSMFLMQKLSPQPADSTQAKMLLWFMPIFFTFIMFQLPAGLALYSVVNNVLSIIQQQIMNRRSPMPAPAGGKS
ncbi:MAG: membrane protein insertase YidC [Deltaproteobacteria bacterium]|nr:membrane protein insertase YidC [Deltaproteobacteria bacterium]